MATGKQNNHQEISDEKLKEIQAKLKKIGGGYMDTLVAHMNSLRKEMHRKKKFNTTGVYNIFNGIVKSQSVRLALYKKACLIIEEYEKELAEVLD